MIQYASIVRPPLPAYHSGQLLVKTRETFAEAVSSLALQPGGIATATAGLNALSVYERGGLIKAVRPLSRPRQNGGAPLRLLSSMAIAKDAQDDQLRGVSILETESDAAADSLRLAIAADPHFEFASRIPVRYLLQRPPIARPPASPMAVPPTGTPLWNLLKIQWQQARARQEFQDANQVRVAVLDTGVDDDHPDLQRRVAGYVFAHPDLPVPTSRTDYIGHGTHVSGTIGATVNNNVGIDGICQCQIFVWKIFGDSPTYVPEWNMYSYFVDPVIYRRALNDCVSQSLQVMNLSIGGAGLPDPLEKQLFGQLVANGCLVCAAMGNDRQNGSPTSYPAAIEGVIAVGATSRDDTIANFSNSGNHICISAPGVAIWSTLPTYPGQEGFKASPGPTMGQPILRETDYDAWDGTSMATPHVSGACALLLANKQRITPAIARNVLMSSADKVPGMGGQAFTPDYGAGRLNLYNLLS
jgi:subtilisin family serine protease